MKPKLTVLVGPPCSGKSTYAADLIRAWGEPQILTSVYINQDSQGKDEHFVLFKQALNANENIVLDRMNFNKQQRQKYIEIAEFKGYETEIIVLHESKDTCIKRGMNRLETEHHGTINTKEDLYSAVNFFFSHYERPTEDEADTVTFKYPEKAIKLRAVVCDIDGTAAKIDHRLHYVQGPGKRDWKSFFKEMNKDEVNFWCRNILQGLQKDHIIVMCSGRPDSYREVTETWLKEHKFKYDQLFMRPRDDHRDDSLIKEILLDFEILTRYDVEFTIDDRKRVVDMWRRRGLTCLACAEGEF